MPSSRTISLVTAIVLAAALYSGCNGSESPVAGHGSSNSGSAAGDNKSPATPANLRLLVVGDTELAQRVTRLRAEWSARAGTSLDVSEIARADLANAKSLAADVVIYPSSELGTLAERRLIRPLPVAWLAQPAYHEPDLFELPGQRETAWGEQTYAVPLGSPVFVCFYRADLFASLGRTPPRTWDEYQQAAEFFAAREKSKTPAADAQSGTLEPLAAGWAGNVLLARSAAYAKHRDYYSTLFDKESLEPRIAGEPFVRALTELVAAAKLGPKSQLSDTPADVRREFFAGHTAMGLSWPTPADNVASTAGALTESKTLASAATAVGFVELPGSPEVFNPRDRQWMRRKPDDEPHVPLLGIAGRMGSIVRGTPSGASAFELLIWLSTDEWSAQISTSSPATTLFRRSQMVHPDRWVESGMPQAAAKQYVEVAARAFSRPGWLFSPRLPGHEEYLAALDNAVRHAVDGSATPAAALRDAAAQWQKITDRIGRAAQKLAYTRSIGLEPQSESGDK